MASGKGHADVQMSGCQRKHCCNSGAATSFIFSFFLYHANRKFIKFLILFSTSDYYYFLDLLLLSLWFLAPSFLSSSCSSSFHIFCFLFSLLSFLFLFLSFCSKYTFFHFLLRGMFFINFLRLSLSVFLTFCLYLP